ncbi:hypothetical protein BH20ACI2_BH20ACI2_23250 [soil metagenome]
MDNEIKKTLWATADKLRSNMDAAEYKHIVLGLIFLKYISDSFAEHRAKLAERFADPEDEYFIEHEGTRDTDLEERDYYTESNVFWVPELSRWERIREKAKQPILGRIIDDALVEIESENPRLKVCWTNVLPVQSLNLANWASLSMRFRRSGWSATAIMPKICLARFTNTSSASLPNAEGKKGGQFYTPATVVKVLVEVLAPHKGKVYDPCCGSGGMFVQSEKFMESHGGQFGTPPQGNANYA